LQDIAQYRNTVYGSKLFEGLCNNEEGDWIKGSVQRENKGPGTQRKLGGVPGLLLLRFLLFYILSLE